MDTTDFCLFDKLAVLLVDEQQVFAIDVASVQVQPTVVVNVGKRRAGALQVAASQIARRVGDVLEFPNVGLTEQAIVSVLRDGIYIYQSIIVEISRGDSGPVQQVLSHIGRQQIILEFDPGLGSC